jgi:hypothetical protein
MEKRKGLQYCAKIGIAMPLLICHVFIDIQN